MPLTLVTKLLLTTCMAGICLGHAAPASSAQQWWERADIIGQAIDLPVGPQTTPAIHREQQLVGGRGTLLLLHGPGGNADRNGLVRQLRLGLSDAGWDTLSVQLPKYFSSDTPQRWLERHDFLSQSIQSGLDWLSQQREDANQVIVAVGPSGRGALAFAAGTPPELLQALVLISTAVNADSDSIRQLAELELPVLDLYAERDQTDVQDASAMKREAASDNRDFKQRMIAGTDHRFSGAEGVVVATVRAWLAANTDGREQGSQP